MLRYNEAHVKIKKGDGKKSQTQSFMWVNRSENDDKSLENLYDRQLS